MDGWLGQRGRRRLRTWLLCLALAAAVVGLLAAAAGCAADPARLSANQVLACELQAEIAAQAAVNAGGYQPPLPWGVRHALDRDARCWTDLVRVLKGDPAWRPPTTQPEEEMQWHDGRAHCW